MNQVQDSSIKAAAQAVGTFFDELMVEQGFSGSQAEKLTEQAAPIIVSYVLYHGTLGS